MPKYKVIGDANVTIKDIEYKTGESFEAPQKEVSWLVDDGYISPTGKAIPQPEPEEEGDDE